MLRYHLKELIAENELKDIRRCTIAEVAKETGIKYREFEVTNETQREQAIRRMAQRGADPILGIGFAQAPAIETVAKEFPKLRFAIIDMVVDLPNVQSIVFKEHEGSFPVGVLAAAASNPRFMLIP